MFASLGVCLLSAWLHSALTHRCNLWMYSLLSKDASAEYSDHVELGQRTKRSLCYLIIMTWLCLASIILE